MAKRKSSTYKGRQERCRYFFNSSIRCTKRIRTHGLAISEDSDVSYVIASEGEMADAMGFSVR
jgi:hypothetical protein